MMELESHNQGTANSLDQGYVGSLRGRGGNNRCRDLTKESLGVIFAEDSMHMQFKRFASHLWVTNSTSMTTPVRIIAEYDFHNVIFCREQHFTTKQTIAFREIALSVFETAIVNGKLQPGEAFEAFTHRVLALAGAEEAGTNATGTIFMAAKCGSPLPCKSGASAAASGETADPGQGGGSSDSASATGNSGVSDGVGDGEGGESEFSVGDVGAITKFVAQGFYRNFKLYRMCFQHEQRCCRETRQVQVETPLEIPPLHEGAESNS
ncbi:unnamed protein product [Hapterophycus canaliculatus]